jgi:hypothetical protein
MRRGSQRARLRALLSSASALALLGSASGGLAAPTAAAVASVSCSVTYTDTNDWGSGFTAGVTIKDTGSAPISNWVLNYSYAGN